MGNEYHNLSSDARFRNGGAIRIGIIKQDQSAIDPSSIDQECSKYAFASKTEDGPAIYESYDTEIRVARKAAQGV